jgi:uncharacterized membrane protein/thiol-disulfide isomerase/thioredoxin
MMKKTITILVLLAAMIFPAASMAAAAESPVVRAVLFFSPTCPHCHEVINNILPPLLEKYDQKLDIAGIDVTQEAGYQLYQAAVNKYLIPDDRLGVPTLIIGSTVMVGSVEIAQQFPQLIDQYLASGGIDWPEVPGLAETIAQQNPEPQETQPAGTSSWLENFQQDPVANTLSVLMLVILLVSVIRSVYVFMRGQHKQTNELPTWVVPTLSLVGLGVAAYLAFVENTQSLAVCGPIGDCNTVQQSEYAMLFGILPVGVLGMIGYTLILAAWIVQRYGPADWKNPAWLVIWAMALVGALFSLYLTFLEPFVIGATCLWCLSSALIMSVILWAVTPIGTTAWQMLTAPEKNRRTPRRA